MKSISPLPLLLCGLLAANLQSAEPPAKTDPAKKQPAKAPKPPVPVFLTPEAGGADFRDQGEYADSTTGAQVIALGKDKFQLTLLTGGLPGAGWDKQGRVEIPGQRQGEKIVFTGAGDQSWTLEERVLRSAGDAARGKVLKRVERASPTLGAKPPAGAIVLFDGTSVEAWQGGKMDDRKLLMAGAKTKQKFNGFTLHVEFLLPFKPEGRGQDRGNSGIYIQDRYEVQVLDSFGLKGEHNECGGLYKFAKPAVNMCFPPLVWQTYDIEFDPPQFDAAGVKTRKAIITVKHNGVVIHDRQELAGPTGGGQKESPAPGPVQLQNHGNPVFYRNIWLVEKK